MGDEIPVTSLVLPVILRPILTKVLSRIAYKYVIVWYDYILLK